LQNLGVNAISFQSMYYFGSLIQNESLTNAIYIIVFEAFSITVNKLIRLITLFTSDNNPSTLILFISF
jgi:hypothetical protein